MSWVGSSALVWDAERLRVATDAAGVALWSWNVDTDEIALDERAHALWGVTKNEPVTFESLSACIHPKDVDRVRTAFTATRRTTGAYEIDFRILHGADIRWISARGQGDDRGIVERVMFGVFLDVTDRKQVEESREMLAEEMTHRVKNLFAVASALTSIAARSATTVTDMAKDLRQRLSALGRAHDLVRPIRDRAGHNTPLLSSLLVVLLAPYTDKPDDNRVHVFVPDVRVGEASMATLALIVHELATNSVKYGALSVPAGRLDVSSAVQDNDVTIVWTERGGPPVMAPTEALGFGSKLVDQSIGQIGGAVAYDWNAQGVTITLQMSKARLEA